MVYFCFRSVQDPPSPVGNVPEGHRDDPRVERALESGRRKGQRGRVEGQEDAAGRSRRNLFVEPEKMTFGEIMIKPGVLRIFLVDTDTDILASDSM